MPSLITPLAGECNIHRYSVAGDLSSEPLVKIPVLGKSWSVVLTPARAPALQKAEFHCSAGAPAGLESLRVGSSLCPISVFYMRLIHHRYSDQIADHLLQPSSTSRPCEATSPLAGFHRFYRRIGPSPRRPRVLWDTAALPV